MKSFFVSLLLLISSIIGYSQTVQVSLGAAGKTEVFNIVKYDPTDGGTVHVGYINDPSTTTGNDCFIVKFNSFHQIVWQKYLSNPGDDYFNQVIIAANGDYILSGVYIQGGLMRGIVCRLTNSNGNIVWSITSAATGSPNGDRFYDVCETAANNIAVAGVTNFASGQTNSLVVLLSASGNQLWSRVSDFGFADEFYTVNQLTNGNLILGGFYNVGGNYFPVVLELNETTAAVISQNYYPISISVPGFPSTQNSLWFNKCIIKNNTVFFSAYLFRGFGSALSHCAYSYDQTTKNLSGNLFYHTGVSNATAFVFYPLTNNDLLIAQTFSTPTSNALLSRVTNSSIVYDRKINGNPASLFGIDVSNTNVALTGTINNGNVDAYNLFSNTSFPLEATPCNITNSNTFVLQTTNLIPTNTNIINLNSTSAVSAVALSNSNTSYVITNICGCTIASINNGPTDVTLCGTGNAVFTITANNATTTQWQVNTGSGWSDVANSGVYSGATTNSLTITGATTTMNSYRYRCVAANPCSNIISPAATLIVNTPAIPLVSITASASLICAGTSVTFTAISTNGGVSPIYQWTVNGVTVGTNNAAYSSSTLTNGDIIICTVTSSISCVAPSTAISNPIVMAVLPVIANTRYSTVTAVTGQPIQLLARDITGGSYIWTPSTGLNNPTIKNPIFTYNQQQEYLIHISSAANCDIVDTLLVKITINGKGIYVPKAFTPDNNGNNDMLYPFLVGIAELKYFRVYNRWGNLLFETKNANPALGWDGRYKQILQPVESYTWIAEAVDIDGITIKRSGSTLLIK